MLMYSLQVIGHITVVLFSFMFLYIMYRSISFCCARVSNIYIYIWIFRFLSSHIYIYIYIRTYIFSDVCPLVFSLFLLFFFYLMSLLLLNKTELTFTKPRFLQRRRRERQMCLRMPFVFEVQISKKILFNFWISNVFLHEELLTTIEKKI